MTFKRSLLAFGLFATVSGFALASPAAEQPEASFHPAKAWSVASNGDQCAIQDEYNNGFRVGFTGSEKSLRTLNVDFRQNIFETGKNYDIAFTIPGGKEQHFAAMATNASALSIGLPGGDALLKTMHTASAFDLGVEGNVFRFYLSGFAAAAQPFEKCVGIETAAATVNAPVKQAAVTPAAVPGKAPPPPQTANNDAAAMDRAEQAKMTDNAPEATVTPMAQSEKTMIGKTELTDAEAKELDTSNFTRHRMSEDLAAKIAKDPDLVKVDNKPVELQPISDGQFGKTQQGESSGQISSVSMSDAPAVSKPVPDDNDNADENAAPIPAVKPAAPAKTGSIKSEIAATDSAAKPAAFSAPAKSADATPAAAAPTNAAQKAMVVGSLQPGETINFSQPRPEKYDAPAKAAPAPAAAPKQVANHTTPAMVVHTNRQEASFDLTGYGKPDASAPAQGPGAPFSGSAPERIETSKSKPAGASAMMAPLPDTAPAAGAEIPAPEQFASNEPQAAAIDTLNAPAAAGEPRKADPDMLRKISELESTVHSLKEENASLNAELKSNVNSTKEEQQSISSENWNLESATMRYTEAERELKALGTQMQQERAQCSVDKQELEAQLFDPQVTSQQQIAHLADLEQKLAAAQQQLETQRLQYEERIKAITTGHRPATQ